MSQPSKVLVPPLDLANHNSSPISMTEYTTYAASSLPFNQASGSSRVSSTARNDEAHIRNGQSHPHARDP